MDETKTTVVVSDDYTQAIALTRRIAANAQAMQQSLHEVCSGLLEMRDRKLYKELGCQNFADYCEQELGISRFQGRKYADIGTLLKDENGKSTCHFEALGTEKLYLLAKLDEPTRQEITQTVDVESVTVKELQAHIKELETENAENEHAAELLSVELDEAKQSLEKKNKQFKAAMESKQNEIDDLRAGAKKRTDMLITKIQKLQTELEEAKQKPDAVTVEDVSRIEELTQELADCREQLRQAQQELAEKPMVQEALPVTADHLGEFRAYYAAVLDDLKRLFGFAQSHSHSANMPLFLDKISNIVNMYETEIEKMKVESSCL